jgi:hypothetical protein
MFEISNIPKYSKLEAQSGMSDPIGIKTWLWLHTYTVMMSSVLIVSTISGGAIFMRALGSEGSKAPIIDGDVQLNMYLLTAFVTSLQGGSRRSDTSIISHLGTSRDQ